MTITHALDLLGARLRSLPIPPGEHEGRTALTPLQQPEATPSQCATAAAHLVGRAASQALFSDFSGARTQAVTYGPVLRQELLTVAASAVLWLQHLTDGPEAQRQATIFDELDYERALQDLKWGVRDYDFQPMCRWATILLEEAGEVAQEVFAIEIEGKIADHLRVELVQLAAVAVAWMQALPEETP